MGYMVANRMLSEYIHELARNLAPRKIRANVVHPANVNTDMLHSEPMYQAFCPDLEHPTRQDAELAFPVQQAMPIPYVEPVDISNAVLFLASDEARYITGMQLRVDAGGLPQVVRLPSLNAPRRPRRRHERAVSSARRITRERRSRRPRRRRPQEEPVPFRPAHPGLPPPVRGDHHADAGHAPPRLERYPRRPLGCRWQP